MARIRTIKPEFPQSETIGKLSREARLLFIQLWTLADDEGMSPPIMLAAAGLDHGDRRLQAAVVLRVAHHHEVVGDRRQGATGDEIDRIERLGFEREDARDAEQLELRDEAGVKLLVRPDVAADALHLHAAQRAIRHLNTEHE